MLKNRLFVFGIVILLVFSSIIVIGGVDAQETLEDEVFDTGQLMEEW